VLDRTIPSDQVQFFCSFPATMAPYPMMQRLKGDTAAVLTEAFSWLKSRLPRVWTTSGQVGTTGHILADTLPQCIQAQKGRQMFRTYKYRLFPTPEQAQAVRDILQVGCWLYNAALRFHRKRWQESRHRVTYDEQAAMWRDWRNEEPEDNPLRRLNMTADQWVLCRLDSAFRAFFQGKGRHPRFKKSHRFKSVNYKPGSGSRIKDRKLYMQNVGLGGIVCCQTESSRYHTAAQAVRRVCMP
jgi:hypothetical protein